jgi:60 kDa SS-A/Ro ribonucleoprotein
MSDALTSVRTRNTVTPQTERARADQVVNNAGGFVFEVSPETRIRRFLILGTEGGTYYQGERELTKQNGAVVIDWATNRTVELVNILLEISEAGRAPKQNPTIFALAAAAGLGDDAGRAYALAALPRIARTGTHLFLFAKYVEQFRGWGRGLRKAVANWYDSKLADSVAYQTVKYRQREGWSHRDLLRLAHPTGGDSAHKALYDWVTKNNTTEELPGVVRGFLAAQSATTVSEWERLIAEHRLSWEMLPDVALKEADVWRALINNGMPMGALIRQLPRLTNLGVLKGGHLTNVVTQLSSQEALTKARIHPVNVLTALRTYANGHGFQGSNTWTPNVKIIDALDSAFYASFGNVVPANKRTMNALDVSGSMDGWYFGSGQPKPWTPRDISVAMSLVTLATEPEVLSVAFQRTLTTLNLSSRQRLDDAINYVSRLSFGATDCSLPMLHAREKSLEIDTFVVWTDSETWAGRVQPFEALQQYRKASGIDARLIVCGVTATDFTIADPRDAGMLDVVGFDSAVPNLISDFSAGKI